MFKPLLTRLLSHLISQNSWAKPQLQPFGGKSVRFQVFPLSATLIVLEDGGLAMAGDALSADASVKITPGVAMRLAAGDKAARTLVIVEGDSELATVLASVMEEMSWDFEEDLSHLIGDAPAHQLAEFGREVSNGVQRQSINAAEMVAEYWQEEMPLLAKKRHVENFVKEVDILREDTDRLQKRIEKLATQLSHSMVAENQMATENQDALSTQNQRPLDNADSATTT